MRQDIEVKTGGMTEREQEIFNMLLTDKTPKDIACILKISLNTVLYHQKKLYRKLGINSRVELFARYANGENVASQSVKERN